MLYIATSGRLDGPVFEYWQGQGVLQNHPDQLWGPPSIILMGTAVFFPGEKWLGGVINHLFQSSNEVKNEGAVP